MKRKIKVSLIEKLFLIVLLLSTFLRIYNYNTFSLSNDELSALSRTAYDNMNDLFMQGVKLDFHPAGIQLLLYYWVRIFGDSEASLRFPFVISGILSVCMIYLLGSKWFNKITGLFAATSLAFLQFPILYSQIARPYSTGLLFTLLSSYFWTLLLFKSQYKPFRSMLLYSIGYCLSTTASMYNHYFSFLFVAIAGITGLFFIKKYNWYYFIPAGIFSLLLFIPHLKITLYHFSIGGLGSWLGKPGNDWFVNHIRFIFNQSNLLFMVFIILFLFSIIVNQQRLRFTRFHYISLLWFFIPLLIAFYYSRFVNPVLQNSILIFSFPYLLIFVFSYFNEKITNSKILLFFAFLFIGTYNTVVVYGYYKKQHFGEFKDIARTIVEWDHEFGDKQVSKAINVNAPFYINYYLEKYTDEPIEFVQYENQGGKDLFEMLQIVNNAKSEYFMYAWTKPAPYEIPEIIKTRFPYLIRNKNYSGLSEISLFSKNDSVSQIHQPQAVKIVFNGFETADLWGREKDILDTIFVKEGKYSCCLDSLTEFGPGFSDYPATISLKAFKKVIISTWAFLMQESESQVVLAIENDEGNKYWASMQLKNFVVPGKWGEVYFTVMLPDFHPEKDRLSIYIWNTDKKTIYIDNMKIRFYEE